MEATQPLIPAEGLSPAAIDSFNQSTSPAKVSTKQRRASLKVMRRALRGESLHRQRQAWLEACRTGEVTEDVARAEARKIDEQVKALLREAPWGTWADDIENQPARWVGDWPPGGHRRDGSAAAAIGDGVAMRRGKGERTLYPASYLTTSGHALDLYYQYHFTGSTEWVTLYPTRAGPDGRRELVRTDGGEPARVQVRYEQQYRSAVELAGELLTWLAPTDVPIDLLAQDLLGAERPDPADFDLIEPAERETIQKRWDDSLAQVRGLVEDLQGKGVPVGLDEGMVFVLPGRWPAVAKLAEAYERSKSPSRRPVIYANADGYRGSVVDIRDLPRRLRHLYRRGDPGILPNSAALVTNVVHDGEEVEPRRARKARRKKGKLATDGARMATDGKSE